MILGDRPERGHPAMQPSAARISVQGAFVCYSTFAVRVGKTCVTEWAVGDEETACPIAPYVRQEVGGG